MIKRKSNFKYFSTDALFAILKQRIEEVNILKNKEYKSSLLETRINDLEAFIRVVKNLLVERFLEENMSLSLCGKKLLDSEGIVQDVYKEVFTLELLEKDELMDINLLVEVVNKLDVDHIQMIMHAKKDTVYEGVATERFNEMIFDVGEDVYNELLEKKDIDESEIEEENKVDINTPSPFTIENTISIRRFVNDYLSIPGDCSNLLHCGLKDLGSNYVMGVDNNFANKNPELVYQGYLLLVIDAHGNRGTYINPNYLDKLLNKDKVEKEYKEFSHKVVSDLSKIMEYYSNYVALVDEITENDNFYKLLKETKKIKQYKKLMNERENKNEKY